MAPKPHKSMATNVMMQDAGRREVDAAVAAQGRRAHTPRRRRGADGDLHARRRGGDRAGAKTHHNASANAN